MKNDCSQIFRRQTKTILQVFIAVILQIVVPSRVLLALLQRDCHLPRRQKKEEEEVEDNNESDGEAEGEMISVSVRHNRVSSHHF